jgi:hypothetical protein
MGSQKFKENWIKHLGCDLTSEYIARKLPSKMPAVYLWRRGLQKKPECATDIEVFKKWLNNSLLVPYFKTQDLKISNLGAVNSVRSGFIELGHISLGGGEISKNKEEELMSQFKIKGNLNKWYRRLRNTLEEFGPILYVGETDDIQRRVIEHSKGQTELLSRLDKVGLSIDEIIFLYFPLPSSSVEERTLFEQILTHLLIAPLTVRPG